MNGKPGAGVTDHAVTAIKLARRRSSQFAIVCATRGGSMAISAIAIVHVAAVNGVARVMTIVAGTVGGLKDKTSGRMVRGGVIEEVSGMASVAGAASIGHPGADHSSLAVTGSRSL